MRIGVLAFYGRQKKPVASNRIYGLCQGLSKQGLEVYLFTVPTSLGSEECFDLSFCKDIVEFSAFPIPFSLYEMGQRVLQKVVLRGLFTGSLEVQRARKRTRWLSAFQEIQKKLWHWRYSSPVFRDDTKSRGYFVFRGFTALKLLRYIRENNVRVLFTSHGPSMSHELGLYLKRKMGTDIYWVADFRDPMVGNSYVFIESSKKLRKLQRDTFVFADLVTMVSHSMVQDALEFARAEGIDVDKKKFFCLYNGFSAVNLVLDSLEEFLPPKKLRISYTGTIYLGKRDLTTLLHALSCLSEVERRGIEFVYAGPQADFVRRLVEEYHLSSCCCVLGEVSKETALQIQRSSDVLLLLKSDDDRGVFTGKYFEYLSSGKPILVLGDKDEEFNEVALSMGGIRIVPKGSEGAKEIVEILKALLTKDIDSQEGIWTLFGERKIEEVNRFHWDYLSRCLYERIVRDLEDGVFIT